MLLSSQFMERAMAVCLAVLLGNATELCHYIPQYGDTANTETYRSLQSLLQIRDRRAKS